MALVPSATSTTRPATSLVLCAAFWVFRDISWVAARCCSTADAIVVATTLTSLIAPPMRLMAHPPHPCRTFWTLRICADISSVAFAVCEASDFTSEATTANPLPASPARSGPDGRIECEQIRLSGDVIYQTNDIANLCGRLNQALDRSVRLLGFLRLPDRQSCWQCAQLACRFRRLMNSVLRPPTPHSGRSRKRHRKLERWSLRRRCSSWPPRTRSDEVERI